MASSQKTSSEKIDKLAFHFKKCNKSFNKITERIEFIKLLLEDTQLEPMIDFSTDLNNENKKILNKQFKSFKDVIKQIGGKLLYIKSGTTGHTFKGISYPDKKNLDLCINYAVKVVAYPKEDNYGSIAESTRPENAELMMIKLLSYFVVNNQTPHIVLPIATFNANIKMFTTLAKNNIIHNKKYDQFIKRYENNEFYDNVSVLISEWADGGDLLDYLRSNFTKLSIREWRVLFFQILSALAVIQTKYPGFRHNDLKANNILLQKIPISNKTNIYKYNINDTEYYVPNIGLRIKLWDFDFACIPNLVDNLKVLANWTNKINVKPEPHPYYDVHYFFSTLTSKNFINDFYGSDSLGNPYIPKEVTDFIQRVYPEKLRSGSNVTERGRLLLNFNEITKISELKYKTPDDIIKNDPFFKKMRPNTNKQT